MPHKPSQALTALELGRMARIAANRAFLKGMQTSTQRHQMPDYGAVLQAARELAKKSARAEAAKQVWFPALLILLPPCNTFCPNDRPTVSTCFSQLDNLRLEFELKWRTLQSEQVAMEAKYRGLLADANTAFCHYQAAQTTSAELEEGL